MPARPGDRPPQQGRTRLVLIVVVVVAVVTLAVMLWPVPRELVPVAAASADVPSIAEPLSPPPPSVVNDESPAPDAATDPAVSARERAQVLETWMDANATAAVKDVDEFCEIAQRLERTTPRPRTHDAASFMSGRMPWPGQPGLLTLPAALVERVRANQEISRDELASLDFTWMHELLAYDFWSIGAIGPVWDQSNPRIGETPSPDFASLWPWLTLRMMKGRAEIDLATAELEVRHLDDLIATTGFVDSAYGQQPEDERRNRVLGAAVYFLGPRVPPAVKARALACLPGRCARGDRVDPVLQAVARVAASRDLNPNAESELAWLIAAGPCDPALAAVGARSQSLQSDFWKLLSIDRLEEDMQRLRTVSGAPASAPAAPSAP